MIRLRKHIAIILLGIFFFPIIFQSVHTVLHTSHVLKHHYNQTEATKIFHSNGQNIHQKDEACLICDYHFAINDSPKICYFGIDVPSIDFLLNELAIIQLHKQVFSDKTPRAPPALIS